MLKKNYKILSNILSSFFYSKEFWKVVNTIYTIEDSGTKYKVFVDLDSKITIAEYSCYKGGRDGEEGAGGEACRGREGGQGGGGDRSQGGGSCCSGRR